MLRKSIPPTTDAEPIALGEVLAMLHAWLHRADGGRPSVPPEAPRGDDGADGE
ncbi:MAG: hypothetical protein HYV09_20205 [Deltaproteobacteria bacterium]|nr:hypothetical protein [Deltaproteobacteria bacterium]